MLDKEVLYEREEKSYHKIDKNDIQLSKRNYNSRHVYKNLRLTRETIRYYEKIGHLPLLHRDENGYHEYSGENLTTLLFIDAFRHKRYSNAQIRKILTGCSLSELQNENLKNRQQLKKEIERLEFLKQSLEDENALIERIPNHLFQFFIRDMPSFKIIQRTDSLVDFQNYEENVLPHISEQNGIISQVLREVTFDFDKGYLNSNACIIQPCEHGDPDVVHSGKAIYSIVENKSDNELIMKKMFVSEEEYIKLHNLHTKGVVYINTVLQHVEDNSTICYHESWVPIAE